MTKRKRRQQVLLDYKVQALHSLEKRLDKMCGEYNACVFKKSKLKKELLQTEEDTMGYDQIKLEMHYLDKRIYQCQEAIRDISQELDALRQEVYHN